MIQQDYLLRLIQQLGDFFRRTLAGKSTNSSEELDQHLEQLSEEILGLPSTLIMTLPPEEIINLFEMSDRMVIEKCFVTAEIHRIKSQLEEDPELQKLFRERAIFFFETIAANLQGELGEQAQEHLKELGSK